MGLMDIFRWGKGDVPVVVQTTAGKIEGVSEATPRSLSFAVSLLELLPSVPFVSRSRASPGLGRRKALP